jgi:hypothetical protein
MNFVLPAEQTKVQPPRAQALQQNPLKNVLCLLRWLRSRAIKEVNRPGRG